MTRPPRSTWLAVLLGMLLAGCTTAPIERPYTPEELAWQCTRTGGWWRQHVSGGYCEYEAPMQ